jgi:hypothetical protein
LSKILQIFFFFLSLSSYENLRYEILLSDLDLEQQENTVPVPPQLGEEYQPMSFCGKNMKRGREKGGKCKRKRKKGERKRENG